MKLGRRELALGLFALPLGCGRRAGDRALAVGYLPTLVQAVPVVAATTGAWKQAFPELSMTAFANSSAVMEALRSGSIDLCFASATAVVNTHQRSEGRAIRVLSTVAMGGASLLARKGKDVSSPKDLVQGTLGVNAVAAMPDVSARAWVTAGGESTHDRGGAVTIVPMPAAESFQLLKGGRLDAVWAQEPWASRLVAAGARRVLDERVLWPRGRMPQVFLVAKTSVLEARRDEVSRFARLVTDDVERFARDPSAVAGDVALALKKQLGKAVAEDVFRDAFPRVTFTTASLAQELSMIEDRMRRLGYLPERKQVGLESLFA